jgi:hypothetical protein
MDTRFCVNRSHMRKVDSALLSISENFLLSKLCAAFAIGMPLARRINSPALDRASYTAINRAIRIHSYPH